MLDHLFTFFLRHGLILLFVFLLVSVVSRLALVNHFYSQLTPAHLHHLCLV